MKTKNSSDKMLITKNLEYNKCSVRFDCLHFVSEHMALTSGSKELNSNTRV